MAKIRDVLLESNTWWKEELKLEYHEREIHKQISKYLPLPQIIALTGLRRVGKTTLMLKIVLDFIKKGFDARNIIYFSFDEFREIEIREVMKEYEALMEKNLRQGKYLLLLDEIQKLTNWEDQVKRIYDTYGKNIKIIISGSESMFIKKKSKETLSGRIFEFKIETLLFKEFLSFKGVKHKPVGLYEKELARLFEEYILCQGFPELVGIKDKSVIRKYVKEGIVEKVIYRDLPQLFKIKDVALLESLLGIIMEEPGQLMEISDLAKELKLSRQTLSNYLAYLEEAFLIRRLYNYSKNRRKTERKLKKYYPAILSDLIFKEDDISMSKVFEWLIVSQLNTGFFWRDPYKNEVDVVVPDKKPVPIEIKYGKIDTTGLIAFMKKFKVTEGYIVSHGKEEQLKIEDFTINVVPAFKFLLREK
ncbi:AAA domain protein [uncultured archaeon]|nr:AAA domain protein [uncultured archaeon]